MGAGRGFGGRFRFETEEVRPRVTWPFIKRILVYFKAYRWHMAGLFLMLLAGSVLGLVPPLLIRRVIDVAIPQKRIRLLFVLIGLYFASIVLEGLLRVAQNYLNSWVSKHIIRDMRDTMFQKIQRLPIAFFTAVQSGEISSRMNNDIGGIERVFSSTFVQAVQNIMVFTTTIVLLASTDLTLALVNLAILPLFILPTRRVGRIRFDMAAKTQEKLAGLNNLILETLQISGITLVKLFNREKDQAERFHEFNQDVTKLEIQESLAGRWFFMVMSTLAALGPMVLYLVGGYLIITTERMTVGSLVMFVSLLSRLYGPVTGFANLSVDITRSLALFQRIFDYLDLEPEKDTGRQRPPISGQITFSDVSFGYGEKEILKDIDLSVEPGKMVAIVGRSGAGKSTLTNLIPRLYDVTEGQILFDGIDARDIDLGHLRSHIGMVTQDTHLFNRTIRENLLFANRDATQEEIETAAKQAQIHDLITSLADGYDSLVGERGVKLSGGERQRISIARALLKDPTIVIMDEATSSLDSLSEAAIQTAIKPLLESRTSLVIAHRLSTIMEADSIVVLDHGRIIEQGRHHELLEKDGLYKEIFDTQFRLGDESDA
ncbi:MAG TPA: ABC transporter ATP-binding protein [Tissierellia bacterium]|nr:ABC transporter ATP-binding protein [Tissierellia bacterium]